MTDKINSGEVNGSPSYTPAQEAAQLFRMHSQSVIDQLSHRQLLIQLTAIQSRLDTEFNERRKK